MLSDCTYVGSSWGELRLHSTTACIAHSDFQQHCWYISNTRQLTDHSSTDHARLCYHCTHTPHSDLRPPAGFPSTRSHSYNHQQHVYNHCSLQYLSSFLYGLIQHRLVKPQPVIHILLTYLLKMINDIIMTSCLPNHNNNTATYRPGQSLTMYMLKLQIISLAKYKGFKFALRGDSVDDCQWAAWTTHWEGSSTRHDKVTMTGSTKCSSASSTCNEFVQVQDGKADTCPVYWHISCTIST